MRIRLFLIITLVACGKTRTGAPTPEPAPAPLQEPYPMPERVAAESFHWVVSPGGAAGFLSADKNADNSFHGFDDASGAKSVLRMKGPIAIVTDPASICAMAPSLKAAHDRISIELELSSPVTAASAACLRSIGAHALALSRNDEPAAVADLLTHLDGVEALGLQFDAAKLLGERANEPDGAALRYVNIVMTNLSPDSLRALAQRKNLRALGFRGMRSETHPTGIAVLAGLPELERIDLSYGPIQDDELAEFGKTKTLRWLSLEVTKVSDVSPLANLEALEFLNLDATHVTDKSLATLAKLPKLKWLKLSGVKTITANALNALPTSLERIELPEDLSAAAKSLRAARPTLKVTVDGER
jgi:hypothetical protein